MRLPAIAAALLGATALLAATQAEAHPYHRYHYHHLRYRAADPGFANNIPYFNPNQFRYAQPQYGYDGGRTSHRRGHRYSRVAGGRPGNCGGIAWCGCFLRDKLGIADRSLNLALNWARKFPRTIAHIGAVVVWNHGGGHGHVGQIVGGGPGHWEVQSGNDGGAVRTRVRDISRATVVSVASR